MLDKGRGDGNLHPSDPMRTGELRPRWLRPTRGATIRGTLGVGGQPASAFLVQAVLPGEGTIGAPVDQMLTGPDGRFELPVRSGVYDICVWGGSSGNSPEAMVTSQRGVRCGP